MKFLTASESSLFRRSFNFAEFAETLVRKMMSPNVRAQSHNGQIWIF